MDLKIKNKVQEGLKVLGMVLLNYGQAKAEFL